MQENAAGGCIPGTEKELTVDLNIPNDVSGDIVLGRLQKPSDRQEVLVPDEVSPNSVQVRIPMTQQHRNGPVSVFFARAIGTGFTETSATATATIEDYPRLLPIAASLSSWESLATLNTDHYAAEHNRVADGPDGIPELTIYPGNWNGEDLPPGNFGSLQIGPDSGTAVMRAQIDQGPTQRDFDYHGGSVRHGMAIPGETGLSADLETAFAGGSAEGGIYAGILGEVRYLPLYSSVTGTGQNAQFTIAKIVCVRIMAANLKGNHKSVVVQPVINPAELAPTIRLTR